MICITANNRFPRFIVLRFVFYIEVRAVTRKQTKGLPFYRISQILQEKNVFRFPENGALFEDKERVSPFYHDLRLDWLVW